MQIQSQTHYQVTAEEGELILTVAVEIEGGMLCAAMRLDAYDPGATGALAGYVANSLALNAAQFPGHGATESVTAERTVQIGPSSIEVMLVEFIAEQCDPVLAVSAQ